jgi:hypothetical protein
MRGVDGEPDQWRDDNGRACGHGTCGTCGARGNHKATWLKDEKRYELFCNTNCFNGYC